MLRHTLPELLTRWLSRRKNSFVDPEDETRFQIYTVMWLLSLVVMTFFGGYNFFVGRTIVCLVLFCSATGLAIGWYFLYLGKAEKLVYRGNLFLFSGMMLYLMYLGGDGNSLIFWMVLIPLVTFYLLGRLQGLVWAFGVWVLAAFFLLFLGEYHCTPGYNFLFSVRFLVVYLLVTFLAYFYESALYIYKSSLVENNMLLQKEIEERLRVDKSLKESELRYRAIYLQAAEGIFLTNDKGDIVECNPQIRRMFGFKEEALIGKNVSSLFHKNDLKKTPFQIPLLLSGQTLLMERRIRTGKGSYIHCEQSAKKIDDSLVIILYRDITERKMAEIALQKANQALDKLAHHDQLTHVANRRKFDKAVEREWWRAKREDTELGVILADIDFFKQYNDLYGHLAGDDCLRDVASAIASSVHRPSDIVARYGGEEFVVLLPNTSLEGCRRLAEKMRQGVEGKNIPHEASLDYGYVTVSFGLAVMSPAQDRGSKFEDLLARADAALYQAKEEGRNRVCW